MNPRRYLTMLTRHLFHPFFILTIGVLVASDGFALPDDSSKPINIQSDRASHITLETGEKTEYFGNVVITQGSMKINGDHIIIHSQQRRVTSIVATGKPAQFEQQSDPAKAPIKAKADTLNYKLNNDTVILTKNAYIEQEGTTVSGNQIEYNIGSEQVKASGNKDNSSRVKMILIPEQKNADKKPAEQPVEPTPSN